MADLDLQRLFDFDESDLAANRSGRLSEKQKGRLNAAEQGANRFFGCGGWFLLILGLVITFIMMKSFSQSVSWNWEDYGYGLPFAVVWITLGPLAWGAFRLSRTKMDNSVQKVQGNIKLVKVERRVSSSSSVGSSIQTRYEVRVGGVIFDDLGSSAFNILNEGDEYIFYYTKQGREGLSCEFVSKGA